MEKTIIKLLVFIILLLGGLFYYTNIVSGIAKDIKTDTRRIYDNIDK